MFLRNTNLLYFGALGGGFLALSLTPLWRDIHKILSESRAILKRRRIYPRFVLGSNEDGRELNVESKELIDKRVSGQTISFSEVKMKWGYRKLKDYDMLIKSCNGNTYYLAIHIWGNKYKLDNGKDCYLSKDICPRLTDLKGIDLQFKPANGSESGQDSKLVITLKSCKFQWSNVDGQKPDYWTLTMTCEGEKNQSGRWEKNGSVFLTLNKDSHKFEYNPVKTLQTQGIASR